MNKIPNFDEKKATDFILNHKDPYVKFAFQRDIEDMDFSKSEFVELQSSLFEDRKLASLTSKQLDTGAWESPEKDSVFGPLQKSTIWTLVLLGQMRLNGSIVPEIVKALNYTFETQYDHEKKMFHNNHPVWGDFMQSHNSTALRAFLQLGFDSRKDVKQASLEHLEHIHGQEGLCKYKKKNYRCAWGLVKNLLFFNEWPENWRNQKYRESVKVCQNHLLSHDLSKADYPRERPNPNYKWINFSTFKTYHSDIFEGLESLVLSGIKSHKIIDKTLDVVGAQCTDKQTWMCGLNVNMKIKLEKKGESSPWLTLRGLRVNKALK
ncbi:MAG: hypothetical protein KAS63_10370 [Candidatus Heimdallarchaeota archaeon]|nr:hypothetical protein [Candidatus Heimdallarchaeota archaeon]MCK4955758.1 hypothetical protein [Candidatus Heimdallarchaeota archaeon]